MHFLLYWRRSLCKVSITIVTDISEVSYETSLNYDKQPTIYEIILIEWRRVSYYNSSNFWAILVI